MTLLLDADSIPKLLLPLLERAQQRLGFAVHAFANRPLQLSQSFCFHLCSTEDQGADQALLSYAQKDCLAITRDTHLAAQLLQHGTLVLNPYGQCLTLENIGQRSSLATLKAELRSADLIAASPKNNRYGQRQLNQFATAFEHCVHQLSHVKEDSD